ncbi:hypothetical protein [Salipiger sp. IMCC34102]|uniref:hypothetical protein n=1 Tax=Salipiger sp. IMCC34102 TaxID=2510647 RepID=UPI001A934EE0|nr:hypothetical protein [Salipiger sp. IMCC34102]
MKTTAPKEVGILLIAAALGLIAGVVAAMFGAGFGWALLVAGVVTVIVAYAVWKGRQGPAATRTVEPRAAGRSTNAPATGAAASHATGATAAGPQGAGADTSDHARQGEGTAPTQVDAREDEAHEVDAVPAPGAKGAASVETAEAQTSPVGPAPSTEPSVAPDAAADPGSKGASEVMARPEPKATGPSPDSAMSDPGAPGTSEVEAQPKPVPASVSTASGAAVPITAATPSDAATPPNATPTPGGERPSDPAEMGEGTATDDAAKPETLGAPRNGTADDLKRIKGVGPKLESALNDLGIYHFDQMAGWSDAELAWVDDNLVGFRGRASRDAWVDQAKALFNATEAGASTPAVTDDRS